MAGAEPPDFSAIIMLCDSVACPEGKLYIQGGGWQTLQSDRYPVRIPRIGVAVIVTVPYARTNERHELSLSFRNGEGRDLPAAKPGSPPGEPVHASARTWPAPAVQAAASASAAPAEAVWRPWPMAIVSALEARSIWMSRSSSTAVWGCGGWLAAG